MRKSRNDLSPHGLFAPVGFYLLQQHRRHLQKEFPPYRLHSEKIATSQGCGELPPRGADGKMPGGAGWQLRHQPSVVSTKGKSFDNSGNRFLAELSREAPPCPLALRRFLQPPPELHPACLNYAQQHGLKIRRALGTGMPGEIPVFQEKHQQVQI